MTGSLTPGLIQQLLSLKWSEPALVIVLAHYLDALGPFLKYFPDAVASVINKLFELLTSLPIAIKVLIDLYFVCVKGHAWIIV